MIRIKPLVTALTLALLFSSPASPQGRRPTRPR